MVDKYGTGQDPDCYPGTSTLVNFLDIQDDQILEPPNTILLTCVLLT